MFSIYFSCSSSSPSNLCCTRNAFVRDFYVCLLCQWSLYWSWLYLSHHVLWRDSTPINSIFHLLDYVDYHVQILAVRFLKLEFPSISAANRQCKLTTSRLMSTKLPDLLFHLTCSRLQLRDTAYVRCYTLRSEKVDPQKAKGNDLWFFRVRFLSFFVSFIIRVPVPYFCVSFPTRTRFVSVGIAEMQVLT